MKAYFSDLFEYNAFCNNAFIRLFNSPGIAVPERSLKLFSHLVNAHAIWNARINSAPTDTRVWDVLDIRTIETGNQHNHETTFSIIGREIFDQPVIYINTKGMHYTNPVREILFHVVNHSTYHRGQIAADLKASGIQPPVTDYIFYKR